MCSAGQHGSGGERLALRTKGWPIPEGEAAARRCHLVVVVVVVVVRRVGEPSLLPPHPHLFRQRRPYMSSVFKRELLSPSPPIYTAKRPYRPDMDELDDEIDELAPDELDAPFFDDGDDERRPPEPEVNTEGDTFFRVRLPRVTLCLG
jgi:hypothetical protein